MRFFNLLSHVVLIILLFQACDQPEYRLEYLPSNETGVDFNNQLTPTGELNILTYLYYYNGGGVAVSDFNNDGLDDLYFTGNQVSNKLYLNQGNLKFIDITREANVASAAGWKTGVTHVDINQDGWMDIYVCKVGSYGPLKGKNELYLNQGTNEKGIPVFMESAADFQMDLSIFSTQSVFFDYDLDGDLDLFLLCHSVHPNRSYGFGRNRTIPDSLSGDRLYENVDGKFVEVTESAGLYRSKIGYGLGVVVSDINADGYPDLYIGNDFFENDYFYVNNGDKTFREIISEDDRALGHTTHYSMGNSSADLNNDGLPDLVSLDMLPEDGTTLKSSGPEDGYSVYQRYLKNGYAPQYMQNTLHLNLGGNRMSEVGFLSGMAATEWSWGVLCADLDLDGYKDLYITNGIPGATNDMDYIKFLVQDDVQKAIDQGDQEKIVKYTRQIPEKKVSNYVFRNQGKAQFEDYSEIWQKAVPTFSNGSALADLDKDGDLDLVVNNTNAEAFVIRNNTRETDSVHYLRIDFEGPQQNRNGIGAKVELYAGGLHVFEENYPVKSYLSTSVPYVLVGLGAMQQVDSMRISWPGGKNELLTDLNVDQLIQVKYEDAREGSTPATKPTPYLLNTAPLIPFVHKDPASVDFDRDPLVPFALSNEGPALAVGDLNNDGLDDVFIGGAKLQQSAMYYQTPAGDFTVDSTSFRGNALSEDVSAVFVDVDNDEDLDLMVVTGGNEFESGDPLQPRLYRNNQGQLIYEESAFAGVSINASCVVNVDLDKDGDQDLVIGSNVVPHQFGATPISLVFENEGNGKFKSVADKWGATLKEIGNINSIAVSDMDQNGFDDLICVGDWMPVTLLLNDGKSFEKKVIPESEGWWNSVIAADVNKDGAMDIVGGNWGKNSRLTATSEQPIHLYRYDFDDNGKAETIVTYFYQDKETLIATKDEMVKQLPFLNKKFLSYMAFSKASIPELLSAEKLSKAETKVVYTLESMVFLNDGHLRFSGTALPTAAQVSTTNGMLADDMDGDGNLDLLLVGNNYEISTQLGRLDASHGVLLLGDGGGHFKEVMHPGFDIAGPARSIKSMRIKNEDYYIVGINNDSPVVLKKNKER